jgi:hypothetical protein
MHVSSTSHSDARPTSLCKLVHECHHMLLMLLVLLLLEHKHLLHCRDLTIQLT